MLSSALCIQWSMGELMSIMGVVVTAPNPQCLKGDMVQKYLDRIKVDKAPGPDDIHPRILKELSSVISKQLYLIFRDSLMTE